MGNRGNAIATIALPTVLSAVCANRARMPPNFAIKPHQRRLAVRAASIAAL
jgi:hypothetical protein